MYEAPPCESQAWKVAPARRQENTDGTYLDHATARRCSEPFALLPAKFLSKLSLVPGTDAGNGEEMPQGLACGKGQDRTRAKLPPAPGPRPLSMPAGPAAPRDPGPTSSDDKEGPPEEEIYLVCEPPSPPHCRTTCAPRPPLGQVPPPRLPKLSKPKIALPGAHHSLADSSPEASSKAPAWPRGSGSPVEDPGMQDQAWYAGNCDRHVAESVLQGVNKRVHGAPELEAGLEPAIHLGRAVQGPRLQHPHPLRGEQPPVRAGQGREEPRGAVRQRGRHHPALPRAPPGADRGQLRLQGAHLPALPRQALRAGDRLGARLQPPPSSALWDARLSALAALGRTAGGASAAGVLRAGPCSPLRG
ncbi:SH2 domain-containing protein 6 isoform X1 [Mauremys mutica]|uniref:SH2 domain-containing protein 6 isoform X1 n=1 Tax=Mauremys mutica TaxID=74926 RepID=UPI001D1602A0|nr:SH2 domain-containing protein 6 isoform X1 [Mauremys mutica]